VGALVRVFGPLIRDLRPVQRAFRPSRLLFSGSLAEFPTSWAASTSVQLRDDGQEQVGYRIAYQLSATAPNSAQGGMAGLRLVWEVRAASS
jgi:hypothetical protein